MSLILAIKKKDRVYMAYDTQFSCGDVKISLLARENLKVAHLENGMLIGHVGLLHNTQLLLAYPDFFTLPKEGPLTKKHIVQNIIPHIFKLYQKNDLLEREDGEVGGRMAESYLLAYGDKLFLIDDTFCVTALNHYAAIGSGKDVALAALSALDAEDTEDEAVIEERLLEAIRITASRMTSVGAPYCLTDTVRGQTRIID